MVKTSTVARSASSFCLCSTPNRCSSSTTTSPRSANFTSLLSRRCVPMMMSIKVICDHVEDLKPVDAIFVSGGNTANMLAVWRVHGVDAILREAWEAGIVLTGMSAGSICWFDAGVTDSFRAELDGLDCLGFLPGSNCPHYDAETARRPAYHRLVADGFPPGFAADDGCALQYRGVELVEAVASRPGAGAYRVELAGGSVRETPLEPRQLQ